LAIGIQIPGKSLYRHLRFVYFALVILSMNSQRVPHGEKKEKEKQAKKLC